MKQSVIFPFNYLFESSINILEVYKNSLINLIMTRKGSRLGMEDYGCGIHDFVFANIDPDALRDARDLVTNDIEKWLPELTLSSIQIGLEEDTNTLNIKIHSKIKGVLGDIHLTIPIDIQN